MKCGLNFASTDKAYFIDLVVKVSNKRAIKMYETAGFVPVSSQHDMTLFHSSPLYPQSDIALIVLVQDIAALRYIRFNFGSEF